MSGRGGRRRQVLQLGANSQLHRYGYSKQFHTGDKKGKGNVPVLVSNYSDTDSEDSEGKEEVPDTEVKEEDGNLISDMPDDSVQQEQAPGIDDELKNFLSEIEAIPAPTDVETSPGSMGMQEAEQEKTEESEGANVEHHEETGQESQKVISKSSYNYSMFVKGESEFVHSSKQDKVKEVSSPVADQEDHMPEEPTTNWQMVKDENTHYYYYWNTVTNEVTWEIPNEYTQFLLLHREYEEKIARYSPDQLLKLKEKHSMTAVSDTGDSHAKTAANLGDSERKDRSKDGRSATATLKTEHSDRNVNDTSRSRSVSPRPETIQDLKHHKHKKEKRSHHKKKHKRRREESQSDEDKPSPKVSDLKPQVVPLSAAAAVVTATRLTSIVPYLSDQDDSEEDNLVSLLRPAIDSQNKECEEISTCQAKPLHREDSPRQDVSSMSSQDSQNVPSKVTSQLELPSTQTTGVQSVMTSVLDLPQTSPPGGKGSPRDPTEENHLIFKGSITDGCEQPFRDSCPDLSKPELDMDLDRPAIDCPDSDQLSQLDDHKINEIMNAIVDPVIATPAGDDGTSAATSLGGSKPNSDILRPVKEAKKIQYKEVIDMFAEDFQMPESGQMDMRAVVSGGSVIEDSHIREDLQSSEQVMEGSMDTGVLVSHSLITDGHSREDLQSSEQVMNEGEMLDMSESQAHALRKQQIPSVVHENVVEKNSTAQDNILEEESERQENNLEKESNRQENNLEKGNVRQENNLEKESKRPEIRLEKVIKTQENKFEKESMVHENSLEKGRKRQESSLESISKTQEKSLESSSKTQEKSLESSSKTQEKSLESSSKTQEKSLESSSKTQEKSLESSSKTQEKSLESSSKTQENHVEKRSKVQENSLEKTKSSKQKSSVEKSEKKMKESRAEKKREKPQENRSEMSRNKKQENNMEKVRRKSPERHSEKSKSKSQENTSEKIRKESPNSRPEKSKSKNKGQNLEKSRSRMQEDSLEKKSKVVEQMTQKAVNIVGYGSDDEEEEGEVRDTVVRKDDKTTNIQQKDKQAKRHQDCQIVLTSSTDNRHNEKVTSAAASCYTQLTSESTNHRVVEETPAEAADDDDGDIDFDVDDIDRALEVALEKKLEQRKIQLQTVSEDKEMKVKAEAMNSGTVGDLVPGQTDSQTPVPQTKASDRVSEATSKHTTTTSHSKTKLVCGDKTKEALPHTDAKLVADIKDMAQLALSKLEFLDISTDNLSRLQVLFIELQTRFTDWTAGGLSTQYFHEQLKTAEHLLQQYELSAVPDGWACQWDRSNSRYYYRNKTTNSIQWEYPDLEGKGDAEAAEPAAVNSDGSSSRILDRGSDEHYRSRSGGSSRHRRRDEKEKNKHERQSSSRHYHRKRRRGRDRSNSSDSSSDSQQHRRHRKSKKKKRHRVERSPSVEIVDSADENLNREENTDENLDGVEIIEVLEDLAADASPQAAGSTSSSTPLPACQSPSLAAGDGSTPSHQSAAVDTQDGLDASMDGLDADVDGFPLQSEVETLEPEPEAAAGLADNSQEEVVNPAVISRPPQIIIHPQLETQVTAELYSTTHVGASAQALGYPSYFLAPPTEHAPPTAEMASQSCETSSETVKKKKKDKKALATGSSIMMKKKHMSSMVQKWQKVKIEVEKEDRAKELRQAAIRKKIEELKSTDKSEKPL